MSSSAWSTLRFGQASTRGLIPRKALGEDVGSLEVGLEEILKQLVQALKGNLAFLFAPGL